MLGGADLFLALWVVKSEFWAGWKEVMYSVFLPAVPTAKLSGRAMPQ